MSIQEKPLVSNTPLTSRREALQEKSGRLSAKSEKLSAQIEESEIAEMEKVVASIETKMSGEEHINTDMVDKFNTGGYALATAMTLGADALSMATRAAISKTDEVITDSLAWFTQNIGTAFIRMTSKAESMINNNERQIIIKTNEGDLFHEDLSHMQGLQSSELFKVAIDSLQESFKSYIAAFGYGALGTAEIAASSAALLLASKDMLKGATLSGEKALIDSAKLTVDKLEKTVESIENGSTKAIHNFQDSMISYIKTANMANSKSKGDVQVTIE